MPANLTQAEKREMIDKAKSAIVLCLGDKVLRDIARDRPRHRCGLRWSHCTWRNRWLIGNSWSNNSIHSRWWSLNQSRSNWRNLTRFLMTWPTLKSMWRMRTRHCCYFVHCQSLLSISRIPSFIVRRAPLLWRKSKRLWEPRNWPSSRTWRLMIAVRLECVKREKWA